ncbi:hypothetical protein ACWJKU_16705 [Methylocaldum sp. MU1018]
MAFREIPACPSPAGFPPALQPSLRLSTYPIELASNGRAAPEYRLDIFEPIHSTQSMSLRHLAIRRIAAFVVVVVVPVVVTRAPSRVGDE